MKALKFPLPAALFLLSLSSISAHAEESMACELTRKGESSTSLSLTNKIVDNNSVVQDTKNELGLRVDASLAPNSFIFVVQDDAKQQRLAFTGAPGSLAWDGGKVSSGATEFSCRKKSSEAAKAIPEVSRTEMNYLVCLVDEVTFEEGKISKTERVIQTVSSSNTFRLPLVVQAETDKVAFSVTVNQIDPLSGLSVKLKDKTNGELAQYAGPPASLKSSFMFGFTQGSRDGAAKFLRTGCAYTDDPKLFLETK